MTTAMDLQKINVKFFAADTNGIRLEDFIPVFNAWIQAADGEFYDIADYSHVHAGPGIILVADEANLSIDGTGGRLGVLYNQKRPLVGSNQERLRFVFRRALENCCKLEQDSAFGGRLSILGNEAKVSINDRLLAPNTGEVFGEIKPEIEVLAQGLYRGAAVALERDRDRRQRFNVLVKASRSFELSSLLTNLDSPKGEVR